MTEPVPILRARNVVRTFQEGKEVKTPVNEVSIDIYPRELVVLMGPSGGGKTTLLSVLSGLLRPDSGQVLMEAGEDLWALSDPQRQRLRLRNFGFIFQGYNLFPSLTALQQLEIVLRWGHGVSRGEARRQAAETLDMLGLRKKFGSRPSELSGGEKQRVAIGRALVKRPKLCFADEPTSALDWANGENVIRKLRDAAHDSGAAVLVVTHDSRLLNYADRAFEMRDGKLRAGRARRCVECKQISLQAQ